MNMLEAIKMRMHFLSVACRLNSKGNIKDAQVAIEIAKMFAREV